MGNERLTTIKIWTEKERERKRENWNIENKKQDKCDIVASQHIFQAFMNKHQMERYQNLFTSEYYPLVVHKRREEKIGVRDKIITWGVKWK